MEVVEVINTSTYQDKKAEAQLFGDFYEIKEEPV